MTNLEKKEFNNLFFNRLYPNEAVGWINGVYQQRVPVIEAKTIQNDVVKFKFNGFEENSKPLNGDKLTIGTFRYLQGNFLQIPTKAANYSLKLRLHNPIKNRVRLVLVINGLDECTFDMNGYETKQIEQDVYLSERKMELTFINTDNIKLGAEIELIGLEFSEFELQRASIPHLYIASDSTVQTYNKEQFPQAGWGEMLYYYLFPNRNATIMPDNKSSYGWSRVYSSKKLVINNKSIGGRSSKSFILEGKLREINKTLRPRDYLLIQWGDNDATTIRPMRYVAIKNFINYIKQYVDSALDRGAIPILITPPQRYNFKTETEVTLSFAEYRDEILKYAKKNNLRYIDLGLKSNRLLAKIGKFGSRSLYMKLPYGQYKNYPEGIDDATHFRRNGAWHLAGIVAEGLHKLCPEIPYYAKEILRDLAKPKQFLATISDRKFIELSWNIVLEADYYVVTKKVKNDVISRVLTTKNMYRDYPSNNIEYKALVSYEVTAYNDDTVSNSNSISLYYPFKCDENTKNIILGLNIYEIDTSTIKDKISFNLRFTENPVVQKYRVILADPIIGQQLVIDEISRKQVSELHNYIVNKEDNWDIFIEGSDDKGHLYYSSKQQICGISKSEKN